MTYAMAIVRFINGMADPMQTGPYARPISMIAQRLGIPAEIVQLRHQATHEDLPSLNVLQSGLWSCIAYLRDYVMGPLVFAMDSPSAGMSTSREAQKRDLAIQLDSAIKRYKKLMKAYYATRTSKAASSTGSTWHGGHALRKLMRDIEEMWTIDDDEGAMDMAREVLLNALVQVGCLVPLARKKRPSPQSACESSLPLPPAAQIRIWKPLLDLASSRLYGSPPPAETSIQEPEDERSLAQDLAVRIVEILKHPEPTLSGAVDRCSIQPNQLPVHPADFDADFLPLIVDGEDENAFGAKTAVNATEAVKEIKSYRFTLITWMSYFWVGEDASNRGENLVLRNEEKVLVAKVVAKALLDIEYQQRNGSPQSSLHMLADYLAKYDVEFSVLIRGLRVASKHQGPAVMITDSLSDDPVPAMEARLRELPDLLQTWQQEDVNDMEVDDSTAAFSRSFATLKPGQGVPGWTLVDPSRWKPCPFGTWLL